MNTSDVIADQLLREAFGPSTNSMSTHKVLTALHPGFSTRLRDFATNHHEACRLACYPSQYPMLLQHAWNYSWPWPSQNRRFGKVATPLPANLGEMAAEKSSRIDLPSENYAIG